MWAKSLRLQSTTQDIRSSNQGKIIDFSLNQSVAFNFCFSSQWQWSIWPILVAWPLDEIETWNIKENIAYYDRKRMVSGFTGFHNCFQRKKSQFRQFEGNELTWPGVTSCAKALKPSTFAFSHYEQHSLLFCSSSSSSGHSIKIGQILDCDWLEKQKLNATDGFHFFHDVLVGYKIDSWCKLQEPMRRSKSDPV